MAVVDERLVVLPFLDGTVVPVEVLIGGETLHRLLDQVAVGHRVSDGDDPSALSLERRSPLARGGALPRPSACADADHGVLMQIDGSVPHQAEVRAVASASDALCMRSSWVMSE